MTTVRLYSRVSTKEQGERGFSLPDQDERLTAFANRAGWEIAGKYQDDCTGTTFERPAFKKLLSDCKQVKTDYVIFTKWSRFSRNTTDAFDMIRRLKNLGTSVQAIDEQIDFSIPQNHLTLAMQLALPQVDNQIRWETTRRGTIQALSQGRYLGAAPTGYRNAKGEDKKPLIIPDHKATHIKRAFEVMASGIHSQRDAVKILKKEGIELDKSRIARILRNQVYIGNILVPAYKQEPAKIIKGIHQPLITEELFYKVQDILDGKKRDSSKTKVNPSYPLKGFLYCTEGHKMTGSCSHGHGGKYHYYHCQNYNKCERFKASKANDEFISELKSKQAHIEEYVADLVIETLYTWFKPATSNTNTIQARIDQQQKEIDSLIDNVNKQIITPQDYNRTRTRYEANLAQLNTQLKEISTYAESLDLNMELSVKLVKDMAYFYQKAPPQQKKNVLSSIITGKMVFDGNSYRTLEWNPFIEVLTNTGAASIGINGFEKAEYGELPRLVAGKGRIIEPFKLISGIKSLSNLYKTLAA